MPQESLKILTRQQLYDQVWVTPMIELAKQFQLSDNGLRKICKKYDIPIPKVGYWQKIKFGKPVEKPLLPDGKGDDIVSFSMTPQVTRPKILEEFKETIVVPERIAKFHPIILQAQKELDEKHKDKGRFILGRHSLDIRISKGELSRACRIMDTIIKVLEERGVKIVIGWEEELRASTCGVIEGEKITFGLDESYKMIKKEPGKFGFTNHEFIPNGKLVLRLKNYFLIGCQTQWSDGKHKKLEHKLDSFINGMWMAAAHLKKRREEREEEHRQWEEKEKEREKQLRALE